VKSDAKQCLASAFLEQIKISCYTEYKAFTIFALKLSIGKKTRIHAQLLHCLLPALVFIESTSKAGVLNLFELAAHYLFQRSLAAKLSLSNKKIY
jgi:hypothetical protein